MSEKIVQTAGRDQLGEFAPMFAHLNDDVLFLFLRNGLITCSSARHSLFRIMRRQACSYSSRIC